MYRIMEANRLMANNTKFYNKRKTQPTARTMICIISKVNEERLTVDAIMPSTSSQLSNITIASNLISEHGTGLTMLPSVGQKGVLLASSQHAPILIATLPNPQLEKRKSTLLSDEFKLGSKDSFLKLSKDKSLSMKTISSASILGSNKNTIISPSNQYKGYGVDTEYSFNDSKGMGCGKEIFFKTLKSNYFIDKGTIIDNENISATVKSKILKDNNMLLDKFNSLICSVDELNNKIELGSLESIDKLESLKKEILSQYTYNDYSSNITIEKGPTQNNESLGNALTITLCNDNEEKSSLSICKDGTMKVTCKDFIIERNEE